MQNSKTLHSSLIVPLAVLLSHCATPTQSPASLKASKDAPNTPSPDSSRFTFVRKPDNPGPQYELTYQLSREEIFEKLKKQLGPVKNEELIYCDEGLNLEKTLYQLGTVEMAKKLGLIVGDPALIQFIKGEKKGVNIETKGTLVEVDDQLFQLPTMEGKVALAKTARSQYGCALIKPPKKRLLRRVQLK